MRVRSESVLYEGYGFMDVGLNNDVVLSKYGTTVAVDDAVISRPGHLPISWCYKDTRLYFGAK